MYRPQFAGQVVSEVPFQSFGQLFIVDNRFKPAWTLLMYSVNGKRVDFDIASLQGKNIVSQYRLKNFVLIGRSLPFAIGNMKLFRIKSGCFRHNLITAIGAAFFISGMVAGSGRFCPDHLFDDALHSFMIEPCIFGQLAVGQCIGARCPYEKEKEKCICFAHIRFDFKAEVDSRKVK